MKKIVLFIILFLVLLCPTADAALGSYGLIVEGGKEEIQLQKGEKEWLFVQNGFTKLPCFKGLTFFSDNTIVATVGLHSGLLRANSYGTANIHVTDENGENGVIQVNVTVISEKPSILYFFLIIIPLLIFLFLIMKKR